MNNMIKCRYDGDNDTWVATHKDKSKFVAYTTLGGSMALGEQKWHVSYDSRVTVHLDDPKVNRMLLSEM